MHVSSLLTGVLPVVHLHFNPGVEAHMLAAIGNKSNILIQRRHQEETENIAQQKQRAKEGKEPDLRTTFVQLSLKKRCHRFRMLPTLCISLHNMSIGMGGYV